ncbi:hypothetical protein Dimus_037596 [Dionaea muscipula]
MRVERDVERERSNKERNAGGWEAVTRGKPHGLRSGSCGSNGLIFSLFVEDLPKTINPVTMNNLFAKFGVIKDVFIPSKRSKAGKRFGFVRYDCLVAAEDGRRARGLANRVDPLSRKGDEREPKGGEQFLSGRRWVPKSSSSGYHAQTAKAVRVLFQVQPGTSKDKMVAEQGCTTRVAEAGMPRGSYAAAVKNGGLLTDSIPKIRGISIGNGWLHRSAVATFDDHRS